MAKKIIWTNKAKKELVEILKYWIERNKSNVFSIKLNNLISEQLKLISEFPESGKRTDIPNVSLKIIHKYLLYYEMDNDTIYILTIRHGSKNPETLKLK
ncbi:type II toxin-antitoxin system RelE/ParE family toxin [Chryseobacterium taichungense]|uniref:Plasmid stabilization system protein ParE n=1 Tax=Chryseobacterium taichungense TaxID=295069 RepID=A0A1H7YMU9_9FLAO|nr:type II toxin-antitoxin system RelE/ParE family toxin [Chryseobacterium taichungense]SEM47566.1 Plasmid stabilization system protein ParE [Chryseobacterium taichungense]